MKYFFIILIFFSSSLVFAQDKYDFDGNIINREFYIDLGFYSIGDDLDEDAIKASFMKEFSDLQYSQTLPDSINESHVAFWHYDNAQKDYTPMSLEYLQYFAQSLSDRQKQLLVKSDEAVFFSIYGMSNDAWSLNKKLTAFISKMSKEKKWIIYDAITSEYFTPESWESQRMANWTSKIPYMPSQFTVHSYREESFCRSITLGMQKFGLPDIVVNNASCYTQDQMLSIINVLAQHLTVTKNIYKDQTFIDLNKISNEILREQMLAILEDNAKKKVILNFKRGKQEEGDPENVLLEIDFESKNYDTPQLYQEQTISDLFGNTEEISHISHSDAILQASEAAKAKLPEIKKLFNNNPDPGYTVLVKAPFEDDEGGTEWMWIEVTDWKTNLISGILQSEPHYIKGLKSGSSVRAMQEDIFDYLLYHPDGTQSGNKTQELILKAQGN